MSSDENAGAETGTDLNIKLPQKRYYRQRAHANPIADHSFIYPVHPALMDWKPYYPEFRKKYVEIIDVGCGYGGFLVALSTLFPDKLSLGFEIRVKVSDYVMDRIRALRGAEQGKYQNIACIRTNAMKYLPNYFFKAQLTKMFFLYPDPHFKKSKYKRRIINRAQLAEYAYVLRPGGKIYTITDVEDLHTWMVFHLSSSKLFTKATELELKEDPVVEYLFSTSEEGIKVSRNNGSKFLSVFVRV